MDGGMSGRRSFLLGVGASLIAAPAIVRVAAHLMPSSPLSKYDAVRRIWGYDITRDVHLVRYDVIVSGDKRDQFGMSLEVSPHDYGRPVPDERRHLDRLFGAVETHLGRRVYAAELIKPAARPDMVC